MPGLHEVTFLPSGEVRQLAGSRGNYYLLEDGFLLEVRTTPAWCRQCRDFTEGEHLEPLDELDQAWVEERRKEWRRERCSPAKCLSCGSADLLILPFDEETPSPTGQGTLLLRWMGMCSTDWNNWYFMPEGERIPMGTKPSYWRLRGEG
jgi:hypothetical protein